MKNHGLNTKDFNKKRNILGETSTCIDSNCTGWFVDSIQGIYWIRCRDPSHKQGLKRNTRSNRVEQVSDYTFDDSDTSRSHGRTFSLDCDQ